MRLLLLLISLLVHTATHAQITVSGQIKASTSGKALIFNVPFDCWLYTTNSREIIPDSQGLFSIQLPVHHPQIIFLIYAGKRIHLYAEPGKTLSIHTDDSLKTIRFGGKLGKENQFRLQLGLTFYDLGKQTRNDSLSEPEHILSTLQQSQQAAMGILKNIPFKSSSAFLSMTEADIRYFAVSKLWALIWSNGVWTQENKSHYGQKEWREALVKAHAAVALSDTNALRSYHYQTMVAYYPRFLQHKASSKEEFIPIAEAVFKKPFAEINREVRQKGERYWEYSALNYGLEGRSLERAIASFLTNGIYQGDLQYLEEAYTDFMKRFPFSIYSAHVQEVMQPYFVSKAKSEPTDIHFVPNSQAVLTLDSLLAPHRGRVIYIDLWGTWCGPCRQEFTFNQTLKDRFKGQPVDFVYVAVEHKPNPEKQWKETILFYHLTGYHILAGKELEKEFVKMYEGTLQFPSYILVDKSGKIMTLYGKRPSDKEVLYKQIEQLL